MNKKYLFGMLLSGAMLAACTADDLNTAPVAHEVNPSAPVFNVSFDGDNVQNRADWLGKGEGWKIRLTNKDVLSLYHGITLDFDGKQDKDSVIFEAFDNAIYKGSENAETGQLTFTTPSMVKEGAAIMVFPADTTFFGGNKDGGLTITIPDEQDENTKKSTPYMSEFLTISSRTGEDGKPTGKPNSAGYDREYDVVMKRAASTLSLTLDLQGKLDMPADVADMVVKKVTLGTTSTTNATPFAKTVEVRAKKAASVARITERGKEAHLAWEHQSVIGAVTTDGYVSAISTTDIEIVDGDQVATFTLLPSDKLATAGGGRVTLATNYGDITVQGTDVEKHSFWHGSETLIPEGMTSQSGNKKNEAGSTTVAGGYQAVAKFLWETSGSGTFKGECNGYHVNSSLDIDETTLNMNNLHITDKQHLQDAIKVFDKIFGNGDKDGRKVTVTFILDGEPASSVNKEKFVMDADTWNAVLGRLEKNAEKNAKSEVKFAPCTNAGEACKAILLDSNNGAAEVPALQFIKGVGQDDVELKMELKNKGWTYKSDASGATAKDIQGIAEIHVLKDAELTPSGFIAVKGEYDATTPANSTYKTTMKLVVDEGAEMKVNGKVDIQIDVDNYGTITIGTSGNLRADKSGTGSNAEGKTLVNCAQKQVFTEETTPKPTINGINRKCGKISNSGMLAVAGPNDSNHGVIHNHGVITVENETAQTAVTTNQSSGAKFDATYAGTYDEEANVFGTIEMNSVTGNKVTKVYDENNKGFIKANVNKDNPGYADFGGADCYANYIVLGTACKNLKYGITSSKDTNLPTGIEYIEVKGHVVFTTDEKTREKTLTGLVVPESTSFTVAQNSKLKIKEGDQPTGNNGAIYLKGTVSVFGTLTGETVVGYLGGVDEDANNFNDSGTND